MKQAMQKGKAPENMESRKQVVQEKKMGFPKFTPKSDKGKKGK